MNHAAAEFSGRLGDDPDEQSHQGVIGREQQSAEQQADAENIGADVGEVRLQQRPAGHAEVSAGADDRSGREPGDGQRGQRGEAGQREQPSDRAEPKVIGVASQEQNHVERRQRNQHVVCPDADRLEQQPADDGAPVAARIRRLAVRRKDKLTGRIGRVVAQQRRRQKDHGGQQRQRQQIAFQTTVFEHVARARVACTICCRTDFRIRPVFETDSDIRPTNTLTQLLMRLLGLSIDEFNVRRTTYGRAAMQLARERLRLKPLRQAQPARPAHRISPLPFGRGVGGEGGGAARTFRHSCTPSPHSNPLPKGKGTCSCCRSLLLLVLLTRTRA